MKTFWKALASTMVIVFLAVLYHANRLKAVASRPVIGDCSVRASICSISWEAGDIEPGERVLIASPRLVRHRPWIISLQASLPGGDVVHATSTGGGPFIFQVRTPGTAARKPRIVSRPDWLSVRRLQFGLRIRSKRSLSSMRVLYTYRVEKSRP